MILRLAVLSMIFSTLSFGQSEISLDGEWVFRSDPAHLGMRAHWFSPGYDRARGRRVTVPDYWERYVGQYDGWGWYARTFSLDKPGKATILFGGADDNAVVWLNGKMIASHAGKGEPFVIRTRASVNNLLVVQVIDKGGNGGIYRSVSVVQGDDVRESGGNSSKQALKSPTWVRDAVVYGAYLRSASPEGTFAGLERRVPELK